MAAPPPPVNINNNNTTKENEVEFHDDLNDEDLASDSDSDPIFSINAQSAAAQSAQSSSCWDGIISIFSSCFSQKTTSIEVDGKSYKIKKLIAEGGFSFVYLASPTNKKQSKYEHFAIKKMIIQTKEQMKQARWEINVMQQLQLQHSKSLKPELNGLNRNEEEKNELIVNNSRQIEKQYKGNNNYIVDLVDHTVKRHDKIPEFKIVYMVFPFYPRGNLVAVLQRLYDQEIEFMQEQRILTIFIKVCYGVYELHRHKPSWAHRDIKLDNILLGADDEPYLMDFGSVSEAKLMIRSRKEAVKMQEWAQKNMSSPYTPPEFFNCPSKFKFDERTDVWALGCLLYAMGFGRSPFDNETGSSALAVLSKVEYPEVHPYSAQYVQLIEWMLKPKLKHRPFVPAIIQRVNDILNDTKAVARKKD
eukprot:CAMPEP_0197022962 /NCGR_PEP_ID=MMETSP1384-20130603/3762_1 /TAXON_ID=29189 /ORGANISM="Ammonia sp." /LENGTH=416 /DNA_ID=CAMNT_0042451095 /DNA_START=9 /DNA_END=1259 /DNA_ORIENTATION=+